MVTRQQGHRPLIEVLYVRLAGQPAEQWVRDALLAVGRSDATTDLEQQPTTD